MNLLMTKFLILRGLAPCSEDSWHIGFFSRDSGWQFEGKGGHTRPEVRQPPPSFDAMLTPFATMQSARRVFGGENKPYFDFWGQLGFVCGSGLVLCFGCSRFCGSSFALLIPGDVQI